MQMLFTGVQDHLDLLKVGLKGAPNGGSFSAIPASFFTCFGFFFF